MKGNHGLLLLLALLLFSVLLFKTPSEDPWGPLPTCEQPLETCEQPRDPWGPLPVSEVPNE